MATRKIKDAKDLSTNELIYFKGHAKATYMSDGTTVEDAINNIETPSLDDYATKEELSSKQDTIGDLEVIRQGAAKGATAIQQGDLSTVATSGSYNDLTNKPTIPNAITENIVSEWGFTKNTGTITGAIINSTDSVLVDPSGKLLLEPLVVDVKMNGTSKLLPDGIVDLGTVITSHQDISGKQDKLVSGTNIKTINGESIIGEGNINIESGSEQVQSDWNETDTTSSAYIANKPDITVNESGDLKIKSNASIDINSAYGVNIDSPAFNGYVNIINSNFKSNSSIHFEDTNGDHLASLIFNGDGTKLLSNDGNYKTIKTINGESILGEGNINIESGSESSSEQVQSDWNETDATSPAYIANKPNIYVNDDHNIVIDNTAMPDTIGLESVSGLGQIAIKIGMGYISWYGFNGDERTTHTITSSGDGTKFLADDGTYKEISSNSSSSTGSGAYAEVNHGTSDTTFTLTPNTFHVWDNVTTLDLSFGEETEGIVNEFLFQFTSGSTATTLTLPDTIKWVNDEVPNILSLKTYQVSIVNDFATVLQFPAPKITFTIDNVDVNGELGMDWYTWLNSDYNSLSDYIWESDGGYITVSSDMVSYAIDNVYFVGTSDGNKVLITDIIIPNHNYIITT